VGLAAESEEEMDRITDASGPRGPSEADYQAMGLPAFCHADYHKGATLAELARLLMSQKHFRGGDHHNDVSMLIAARRDAVVSGECHSGSAKCREQRWRLHCRKHHGAGVHEALLHFTNGAIGMYL
jgi:hypothetical protein